MPEYPNWEQASITATTFCTSGWGNSVQGVLKAGLQDVYRTKGNVSTLRKYVSTALTSTGSVRMSHDKLTAVLPQQHHDELHLENHITDGKDAIPSASTTTRGLMGASVAQKLAGMASNSTRNWITVSSYLGTTAASRAVSIGFRPKYVQVFRRFGWIYDVKAWEVIDGASFCLQHIGKHPLDEGMNHLRYIASTMIKVSTYGFVVRASCAIDGATYYFVSMRATS